MPAPFCAASTACVDVPSLVILYGVFVEELRKNTTYYHVYVVGNTCLLPTRK